MSKKALKVLIILAIGFTIIIAIKLGLDNTLNKEVVVYKAGYLMHPGYLPLFCAEKEGYLETEKFKIELVRFETSQAMIAAFADDQIQLAPLATASALTLESLSPGKFKVFAISSETIENYLTSIVYLPKNMPGIKTVLDLKGKKIGIFPGPAAKVLFTLAFQAVGLKPGTDIQLIELSPQLQVTALNNGQVDALATYEPIPTKAVIELNASKLEPAFVEKNVQSPTQGGSWLISSKLIKTDSIMALNLIKAINKGIDYIRSNPDSIPEILSEYASIEGKVAIVTPIVNFSKMGEINIKNYQNYSDIMFENKVISKRINVNSILINRNQSIQ